MISATWVFMAAPHLPTTCFISGHVVLVRLGPIGFLINSVNRLSFVIIDHGGNTLLGSLRLRPQLSMHGL
jgi:hypothetical protein